MVVYVVIFSSYCGVCAIDFFQALKPSAQLFPQLSRVLKLTPVQEVVFGLALLHSSDPDTQNFASQFVKLKLPDLIRSYIDTGKFFSFSQVL
jgi:CCR4-NOT transcription complex subunit 1